MYFQEHKKKFLILQAALSCRVSWFASVSVAAITLLRGARSYTKTGGICCVSESASLWVKPGSRTETFSALVKNIPVYLPLSGRTMTFDGDATCLAGC